MQNGDNVLPSTILAGCGLLVKMLITFEPHGIFGSNLHTYACLNSLITGMRNFKPVLRTNIC